MTTILLAAGMSERMGKNKLLLEYKNATIIEATLNAVIPFSDKIIVVVGYEKDRIKEKLSKYNVEFVENIDYRLGQRQSSLLGIEAVVDDDFSILPGDLPLLEKDDIKGVFSLLKEFTIARAFYENTPGHPVAYRKENRERLLSFPGSMKEYLDKTSFGVYNSSIGAIFDIDTPDKYSLLRNLNPSTLN